MEQQFNTGKPPAGEAGLMVYESASFHPKCFKFWNGARYSPGRYSPNEAWNVRSKAAASADPTGWRWATLPELLAAGLSEAEALPMLHSSQKPQGDGWGPWIAWMGGECPIPHAQFGDYELKFADGGVYPEFASDGECNSLHFRAAFFRECWKYIGAATGHRKIAAYRVRLTAQQPTEPATTESDRDSDIGDGVDENAAMLARDLVEPPAKPQPVAAERPVFNPFLACAPVTHRFGGWGA